MPTLPTLTVTDAQAQRMLAAFGSVEAYQRWLKQSIINFVVQSELKAESEAHIAAMADKEQATRAELEA